MSDSDPRDPATAVSASRNALYVLASGRGRGFEGFRASIRGHLLELADPTSAHGLAPTPDDLLIASISSDFAWFARRFLRAQGIADYLSVSAAWRAYEDPPRLGDIDVTVTVSNADASMAEMLAAALERRFARRLGLPLNVRVRPEYPPIAHSDLPVDASPAGALADSKASATA